MIDTATTLNTTRSNMNFQTMEPWSASLMASYPTPNTCGNHTAMMPIIAPPINVRTGGKMRTRSKRSSAAYRVRTNARATIAANSPSAA